MHPSRRWTLPALAVALLGATLVPPAQAATSHPATFYPASLFGNAATEDVTQLIGSPGKPDYTVLGTTTGALPGKTSAGGTDAFIRRYTSSGLVTRQYGTAGDDTPYGEAGTIEVGATNGALQGHTNAGGTDGYVWGFKDGKTAWATRLGTAGEDNVAGVAASGGAVYVVGTTTGTFGGQTSKGGMDYFTAKLDPSDGQVQWVHQLGTAGDDRAVSISAYTEFVGLCCGYETSLTVSGDTTGTFPGQTSKGGSDLFTITDGSSEGGGSLDQFGTAGDDVAIAAEGRAVAGWTTGAFAGHTNRGGTDAFVATPEWAYQFGSAGDDRATGLARSRTADDAYPYSYGFLVTGDVSGTLPGLSSHGGTDAFALRVDNNGTALRWRRQFGSPGDDHAGRIVSTSRGAIYAGQANGELDGQAPLGGGDGYLGRVTWTRPDAVVDYVAHGARPTGANVFGGPVIPFYIGSKPRKAWVFAGNNGEQADTLRIVGCASTTVFTVRYYRSTSGADVTGSVLAGTFKVTDASMSYNGDVTAVFKPKAGVAPGTVSYCKVKVYSTRTPSVYDDVSLKVIR